jgi:hypothetical protein
VLHGSEAGLLWIMHVKVDLLDGVGDVKAGERQVLEGSGKALELSQISNRRPKLGGDLGLCDHWCQKWLAVYHARSLKNIESKLTLSGEEPIRLMFYGDS